MKYLFSLFIKLYWCIIPENRRNICIFSESCSRYVKRQIDQNGAISGLKALVFRAIHCRSGYHIKRNNTFISIVTVKGYRIQEKDVSPHIIQQSKYRIRKMSSEILENA